MSVPGEGSPVREGDSPHTLSLSLKFLEATETTEERYQNSIREKWRAAATKERQLVTSWTKCGDGRSHVTGLSADLRPWAKSGYASKLGRSEADGGEHLVNRSRGNGLRGSQNGY